MDGWRACMRKRGNAVRGREFLLEQLGQNEAAPATPRRLGAEGQAAGREPKYARTSRKNRSGPACLLTPSLHPTSNPNRDGCGGGREMDDWARHVAKVGESDRVSVRGSGEAFHRAISRAERRRRALRDVRTEKAFLFAGRLPGRRIAPHLISSTALFKLRASALRTMETILRVGTAGSSHTSVYFGAKKDPPGRSK